MTKKVILHTFPPVPKAYSITPFGIKVESYLRMKKIPYEVVYTTNFGPKGKIPWIQLVSVEDGSEIEIIPDSNCIVKRFENSEDIKKEFGGVSGDNNNDLKLTDEQKAMGHAVIRMIEEHTAQIGFYYRYVLHMEDLMTVCQISNYMFSADTSRLGAFVSNMFQRGMPKGFTKKMKARGLLGHTNDELWEFANDDIKAISNYLDNKQYFFGDIPTIVDCTIFAHLSQFLYIPLSEPFPQKLFIEKECPNLLQYMDRFKNKYWQDWDIKCKKQLNQQFVDMDKNPKLNSFKKKMKLLLSALCVAGVAYVVKKKYF